MLAYLSTIFAGINSSLPLPEEMMNVICPVRRKRDALTFAFSGEALAFVVEFYFGVRLDVQ